jgi:endonuclease-3
VADAVCELDFSTPLELAVRDILSAQSTDRGVNRSPRAVREVPTAADYAAPTGRAGDADQVDRLLPNKTSSLIGLGQALVERYDGCCPTRWRTWSRCPDRPQDRNVILGNAFGVTRSPWTPTSAGWSGVAVDRGDRPGQGRDGVAGMIPKQEWTDLSQRTIWHGRRNLPREKPACGACALARTARRTGPAGRPGGGGPLVKSGAQVAVSPGEGWRRGSGRVWWRLLLAAGCPAARRGPADAGRHAVGQRPRSAALPGAARATTAPTALPDASASAAPRACPCAG